MSIKRKIRLMTLVSVVLAGASVGCNGAGEVLGGGSTNNDQGTSLLAYGYFADVEATTGASGFETFLAADNNVNGGFDGLLPGTTLPFDGRRSYLYMGIQNRMSAQYVRITRIDCDYVVPGADPTLVLPSDSYNTSLVISAGVVDPTAIGGSIVPVGEGSTGVIGFLILSTDIYSYLNVYRNRLPELPFRMIETCRAIGISQAGDVIVTNDLPFNVTFFDAAECCTGLGSGLGGFQTGPGTGGAPTVFNPTIIGPSGTVAGATDATAADTTTGATGASDTTSGSGSAASPTSGTGQGTLGST